MRGAGELPAPLLAALRHTGGSGNARRCSLFARRFGFHPISSRAALEHARKIGIDNETTLARVQAGRVDVIVGYEEAGATARALLSSCPVHARSSDPDRRDGDGILSVWSNGSRFTCSRMRGACSLPLPLRRWPAPERPPEARLLCDVHVARRRAGAVGLGGAAPRDVGRVVALDRNSHLSPKFLERLRLWRRTR